MPNNPCPQPTEEISKACTNATSTAELFESLRQLRENAPAVAAPSTPSPRVASTEPVRMRAFRVVYPFENSKFELVGVDEADLDRQEAAIRQMYAGRK